MGTSNKTAGRSGDQIPVGARFSATNQTGPGYHPASHTMGTWSLPGIKRPERGIDHPYQSSAFVACYRVNFVFTFYNFGLYSDHILFRIKEKLYNLLNTKFGRDLVPLTQTHTYSLYPFSVHVVTFNFITNLMHLFN